MTPIAAATTAVTTRHRPPAIPTPDVPDEMFRASSMPRRAACPGSARMEWGMPDIPSPYAQEGTDLHAAVWDPSLRDNLDAKALEWVDQRLAAWPDVTWHPEHDVEVKLPGMFSTDMVTITRGRCDAVGTFPVGHELHKTVIVVDFKFGYNLVEEPGSNEQFLAYATGAMQEFKADRGVCVLLQPRLKREIQYTFTRPDVMAENLRRIRREASRHEIVLNAGPHCAYCRARAFCPELRAVGGAIELVTENDAALAMIQPENARDVYDMVKAVEGRVALVKDRVKTVVKAAGGETPGLKVITKSGRREIRDMPGTWERVKDVISTDDFLGVCTVAIGKLESLVARAGKASGRWKTIVDGEAWFAQNVPTEHGAPSEELRRTDG